MNNILRKPNTAQAINKKKMHYGIIIVACCCLMMGVDVGLLMSCAGIFYEPVCKSLGVTTGVFGIYMSCSFVTSSLTLIVAGQLLERFSARLLLTTSSALGGICLLAMSAFTQVWQFYLAGCLIGVSLAFLMYLSFPTLINRWFHTKVGFLIGICSAASGIGGVVFNPIGGAIITSLGWRAAYLTFGAIILLIVTPLLAILLRNHPSDKGLLPYGAGKVTHGATTEIQSGTLFATAIRKPVFYFLMIFAFLIMAVSTLNLFIPKYVLSLGFNIDDSSWAAAAIMAGVTLGKVVLGSVNDRDCRLGVLVGSLSGAIGLLLLIFSSSHTLWLVLLGAFCFGWAYAAVTVQTAMLVRTVFGSRDYARIFSVISMALALGGALASAGWGFIADATSFATIFWIGITMLILTIIIGITSLRSSHSA